MAEKYFDDIYNFCRTDIAYTHIENIFSKEKGDQLSTFFFAETMKYFYLLFSEKPLLNPEDYVFSTEAHFFKRNNFRPELCRIRLGL
jgi:hypothetical protein